MVVMNLFDEEYLKEFVIFFVKYRIIWLLVFMIFVIFIGLVIKKYEEVL